MTPDISINFEIISDTQRSKSGREMSSVLDWNSATYKIWFYVDKNFYKITKNSKVFNILIFIFFSGVDKRFFCSFIFYVILLKKYWNLLFLFESLWVLLTLRDLDVVFHYVNFFFKTLIELISKFIRISIFWRILYLITKSL